MIPTKVGDLIHTNCFHCNFTALMQEMKHPKDLSISDYLYHLPEDRIAKYPLVNRESSALLVRKENSIEKKLFASLNECLPENACLVFNNSKVIHARILFKVSEHISVECFCLEPADGIAPAEAFSLQESHRWLCMIGFARKWKTDLLSKEFTGVHGNSTFSARKISNEGRDFIIEFSWDNKNYSFAEVLEKVGDLPIPPYLNRKAEAEDEVRYNTVYAGADGSVAAPTAGLHFTDFMLQKLKEDKKELLYLTLHVGAGTFLPVKSTTMEGHAMHAERIEVSLETIQHLAAVLGQRSVVAVGTTSARSLESLYWMGCRWMKEGGSADVFMLQQWEPYEDKVEELPSAAEVFKYIANFMIDHQMDLLSGYTRLIIAPGYSFRVLDVLMTNFHQPGSTLLLLVAALVGDDWKNIYNFALENEFRFLSFGDASLLFKNQ